VGINGYGGVHTRAALDYTGDAALVIAGLVDPAYESFHRLDEAVARGIPCFASLEAFFAAGHKADLAFIATPIHTHLPLTELAMQNGCHVYCEKPVAGSLTEALEMQALAKKYGRKLEIGFQLSHNPAILAMKRDILEGVWGKPLRMKTIVLWPRNSRYYRRGWAGKRHAANGKPIMDSIASNATAHYIQNMLFLLGGQMDACANPANVNARLFRANDIETFDACMLDIQTEGGVQLLYYAAHCTDKLRHPEVVYEFEKGVIAFHTVSGRVTGALADGGIIEYGDIEDQLPPIATMAEAIAFSNDALLTCPIGAALGHIRVMEAVNQMLDTVAVCPPEARYVVPDANESGETIVIYEGLAVRLEKAYEEWGVVAE